MLTTTENISDKVPFAVEKTDQIPCERYYDEDFYKLENEKFWPHVWQMACRLEEIENKGDYIVYRILDKSIIVIRTDENTVKAYYNHCRHRGVELVQKQGRATGGFACTFHGWRWNIEGDNTYVHEPEAFSKENMCDADLNLLPVKCDTYGGCAWINMDVDAPPLRASLGKFADLMDAWKVEELRVEWWKAAIVPCNWKLAMEAFMEGYHVAATHPQLLPPGATGKPGEHRYIKVPDELVNVAHWFTTAAEPPPAEVDSTQFFDVYVQFLSLNGEGMAGMVHRQEIEEIKKLRGVELPKNPVEAEQALRRKINDHLIDYYEKMGKPIGDLNENDKKGYSPVVNFCFPHYFLLPFFGSASSYRIRPLGPEKCLFELWSLTRYPEGQEPEVAREPEPRPHDDPQWPAIPAQDYGNLPKQQRGLHTMKFMRLSEQIEGLISNNHRLIDGYLAGIEQDKLVNAVKQVSGPIDMPVRDLGY